MRTVLQPKLLSDTRTYQFDFSSLLGSGESISSASVVATVYSGTDPSPSSIVNGSAVLASPLVNQSIAAGVLGTTYELKCQATTTGVTPSQTLNISGFLTILPDLV